MELQEMIYNIMLTIITASMPVLVGFLVAFINQHTNAQQLKTAQSIATNGAIFAQQVSKDLGFNPEQKFNSALASAKTLGEKYGIKLSDDQWKNLIEPSVNEIKKGLNELNSVTVTSSNSESTQTVLVESIPVVAEVDVK